MQVEGDALALMGVVGGGLVGWIISVERRLAKLDDVRRGVSRVDRRLEFLIGTLAGRKVLDDMNAIETADGSGRRKHEQG